MGRTKRVGSTGRFGPRYGTRSKKVVRKIEAELKRKHTCPKCERRALKRIAAGIWVCRKCGYVHEGTEPPEKCPSCQHPKEYYEPANMDI